MIRQSAILVYGFLILNLVFGARNLTAQDFDEQSENVPVENAAEEFSNLYLSIGRELMEDLRQEFIEVLSQNKYGIDAANFFKEKNIELTLSLDSIHSGWGFYDPKEKTVELTRLSHNGFTQESLLDPKARDLFVRAYASTLVHELSHGSDYEENDLQGLVVESEIAAFLQEALYILEAGRMNPLMDDDYLALSLVQESLENSERALMDTKEYVDAIKKTYAQFHSVLKPRERLNQYRDRVAAIKRLCRAKYDDAEVFKEELYEAMRPMILDLSQDLKDRYIGIFNSIMQYDTDGPSGLEETVARMQQVACEGIPIFEEQGARLEEIGKDYRKSYERAELKEHKEYFRRRIDWLQDEIKKVY